MLTFAHRAERHWVDSSHMKIFLSWSKEPSKSVAIVLRTWLQDVIQNLEPWMSDQDIQSGERSLVVISAELEERDFGILILTPENQLQPWINYEAGALSKMVGSSRVAPFLFNFKLSELVPGPLSQFHGREATEEGTRRLLQDINAAMPNPLTETQLKKAFDKYWPDLAIELERISEDEALRRDFLEGNENVPKRTDSDKLDEVLVLIRNLSLSPSEKAIRNMELGRNSRKTRMYEPSGIDSVEELAKGLREKGINASALGMDVGDTITYKIGIVRNQATYRKDLETISDFVDKVLPSDIVVQLEDVE